MIVFEAISITLILLGLGYLLVLKQYTIFPLLAPFVFVVFMVSASFATLPYLSEIDQIPFLNVSNSLTSNFIGTNYISTNFLTYNKNYLYSGNFVTNTLYQNTNSSLMVIYARDTNSGLSAFLGNNPTNINLVGKTDFTLSGVAGSLGFNSMITLYVPYRWYYQFNFTGGNFMVQQIGG